MRKSKEATARVVSWGMGVEHSYTLEASFGGTTVSPHQRHLTAEDYIQFGHAFCEALHEFLNKGPTKVMS